MVESGSRHLFESLIPWLRDTYGENLELDLVTCFGGEPEGFRGNVFRVTDYPGPDGRARLYAELAAKVRDGVLKALVDSTYPIEDIKPALVRAQQGGRNGKVLVLPNGPL